MLTAINKAKFLLIAALILPGAKAACQENGAGLSYQMTLTSNPSVAGCEGDGSVRLSYFNYYPGNNYNFHSVNFSYDGYFPGLHGGAMVYLSDNYLGGIVNDLKGGVAYSYYMQAWKKLFISAGLSASFYNRSFRTGNAVLPDQIDPLGGAINPSAEALGSKGRTVPDLGTGIFFMTERFSGGVAINHLAQPAITSSGPVQEKIGRSILLHAAGYIPAGNVKELRICPAGKFEAGNRFVSAAAGASLESRHLSLNSVMFFDSNRSFDLQTGLTVSTANLIVFYNYRFNLASANSMLPFSLLHQTGLAFRLNNVDKRKTVKTINFPKL